MSQEIKKTAIQIKESDQGGFGITDVFVKNNRWYSSEKTVHVPWVNKLLNISYRDLEGQNPSRYEGAMESKNKRQ